MKRVAIGSFLAGAAAMYFADPNRGRRRRAVARDKMMAAARDVGREFDKAGRDMRNRSGGLASFFRNLRGSPETDSPVLIERVRSRIGRAVSHPHAIHARSDESGRIILEGPILKDEVPYLLKCVQAVPGVGEVVSHLEVYDERGGISSLQGGMPRRQLPEFAQQNWTPSLRVSAGAAGAALLAGAQTGNPARWGMGIAGGALLARAVVNRPFAQMLGLDGGSGAVQFDKTIHIDATVDEVYAYWSNFENFPTFMTHLKEVRRLSEDRSHWVAAGPGGVSIPWDAEVTDRRPNQWLSWRSVPGSIVRTSGCVRFDSDPAGGTRVTVRMSYCPPAGVLGHAAAWLFGADPKSEMDDDLVRLKSLIETGKTRAHGARVTREQVPVMPATGGDQGAW